MNTDFQDCPYTKFLSSIPPFYKEMTLDGIKALLHQLGNFHETLKVVHIAGTNGKGSSVMMLNSIYKVAGYKIGTFTSPYIEDFRECIHIDNEIIDKSLMNLAALKVSNAYQQLIKNNSPLPTHYECITVIALLSMYLEKVDLAIVEVLMGGLNDATNIFTKPLLTLITSISLDHTEYLGQTIELIAAQKAGIIKYSCPVVINKNSESVISIIEDIASKNDSPLYKSDTYINELYSVIELGQFSNHLILNGAHQRDNLKGVLTTLHLLKNKYKVKSKDIINGLELVVHPCRIELLSIDNLDYIIDGSHNEEGILALVNYIKANHASKHLVFILGMLADKDQDMIQTHIYSIADQVILSNPTNERKYDIESFYHKLTYSQKESTSIIPNINDVYTYIQDNKKQATNTLFVACGSLYLCCPFKKLILENQ